MGWWDFLPAHIVICAKAFDRNWIDALAATERFRTLTSNEDRTFKAFTDFGIDDLEETASISRRMLDRLSDIDDSATPGPRSLEARAALATSVVAHAVVELESEMLEVKRLLAARV